MKIGLMYGVGDLRVEEREVPTPRPDEALIRVKAAGICGSDVACFTGRSDEGSFPYTPGHEWSGEVVEVGGYVKTIKSGDRVSGPCEVPCGVCDVCRLGRNPAFCRNVRTYGFQSNCPGAFAEYVTWPEKNLFRLPENLSFEESALTEPLSVGFHAVEIVGGGVGITEVIAISGAGAIGLMCLIAAKASNAKTISIDPISKRRDLALRFGADAVIDPSEEDPVQRIMELTENNGADMTIEASGAKGAIPQLLDSVRAGGKIVLVGIPQSGKRIPIEAGKIIGKGITLKGSVGNPGAFLPALRFIARQEVDLKPLITHRFPLERIDEAFQAAVDLREESLKTMIIP